MIKLSIVIPAHNEEKRIRKTLDDYISHFSDKYGNNFEILVVMDGCMDKIAEIVLEFSKSWKINIKNGGYWR